jgi:hypothetical protein
VIVCAGEGLYAKSDWLPVTPEELSQAKPSLEADAPAEIVFWTVEVDDRQLPHERTTTEYIRYKIFDPEKSDDVTRITDVQMDKSSRQTQMRARLILPNGKIQEFGKESIKERALAKQGREKGFLGWLTSSDQEVKQRFLAIPGVEAGAVLEYQSTRVERYPELVSMSLAQREGIPVRRFDYLCRVFEDEDEMYNQLFVLHPQTAKLNKDKKAHTVTLTATDLPSLKDEPFVGPMSDYALTLLICYDRVLLNLLPRSGKVPLPGKVDATNGPWSVYSTLMNWVERDRSVPTKRTTALAATITAGAKDEAEKARRIHRHVQAMHLRWTNRVSTKVAPDRQRSPDSLDDVVDWENQPEVNLRASDFLWLAISLYQAAGLEAHLILLPDRDFARFREVNVSSVFLSDWAAAVRLGGQWRFSFPTYSYELPFGLLPPQHEGQPGLLALDRKQEFVPVPPSPPEVTQVTTMGVFEVDQDGTLTGDCRRAFTGHRAAAIRAQLLAAAADKRDALARAKFDFDERIVEFTLTKTEGLNDCDKPLELTGKIRWPGFAVLTKDRLLIRPAVFRVDATSPFSSTDRRYPVHFRYRWQEVDRLAIRPPVGYEPEAPVGPVPMVGDTMSYQAQLSYDPAKRYLHLRRDFMCNLSDIEIKEYPVLKNWYDRLGRGDQHEIVFRKRPAPTP